MRVLSFVASSVLLFAACGTAAGSAPPTRAPTMHGRRPTPMVTGTLPACAWALVTRVVDGDTIVVELGAARETVRYIGMDAPETVAPGKPVQPFGPEAATENKRLVEGKQVCLEKDVSERDEFGRLLRNAWLPDGMMVGEALVRSGLARVSTFPPDVKYVESRLLPAQASARAAQAGMWAGYFEQLPAAAAVPPACFAAGKNSCNCSDFATHSAAQAFHDTLDPTDINKLDSNGDGVVCETLP